MKPIRVCAAHGTPLFEREDPLRDTSGLFCATHFPGDKVGHDCRVWNVMVGRKLVGTGSFHPNQAGEHVWFDQAYLADARRHILALIDADEAPEREMRIRSVARVSESTPEDFQ